MENPELKKTVNNSYSAISRRNFLKIAGVFTVSAGFGGCAKSEEKASQFVDPADLGPGLMPSKGYLLVDAKKCQGCLSCMIACSLVHEGDINISLSRIQVMQNPFESFPDDIEISQCRQCVKPACVDACQSGALFIDKSNGNIRRVDESKCIGCKLCIEACPFKASRAIWNYQQDYAQKCDLCTKAPHWDQMGGVNGKQACVSICPVGAISFTQNIPVQEKDYGYNVNLRGKVWASMGYPGD